MSQLPGHARRYVQLLAAHAGDKPTKKSLKRLLGLVTDIGRVLPLPSREAAHVEILGKVRASERGSDGLDL